MSAILMPEVVIYQTLDSIIKVIREEIDTSKNVEETILYALLGKNSKGEQFKLNRIVFFDAAVNLFKNKKNLNLNFGYNPEVARNLSLHILLPNDTSREAEIGVGVGYQENETDRGINKSFNQGFDGVYQIMITSDNSTDVMIFYHILKALMIMFSEHLDVMGLRNLKISGNDIIMRDEYTSPLLFHKVINLSFFYDFTVDESIVANTIKKIYFSFIAVENFDEDHEIPSPTPENTYIDDLLDELNLSVLDLLKSNLTL